MPEVKRDELARLKAQNDRLRSALKHIADAAALPQSKPAGFAAAFMGYAAGACWVLANRALVEHERCT